MTHGDLVATAVDAVHAKGWYFNCNFQPHPCAESHGCIAMSGVRALCPGSKVCDEAEATLDPMSTSLLLIGKAGLCTGLHVDRTLAEDIAFPMRNKAKVQHILYHVPFVVRI